MGTLLTSRIRTIVIAAASMGLAVSAGVNSRANQLQTEKPDQALEWRSDDAVALTLLQDRVLADMVVTPRQAIRAASVARDALRASPLTPQALRQIGVGAALDQRPGHAKELVLLARAVSRHETGALLWLFQESLQQGDSTELLRFADEALLTSQYATDSLFPALSAALFDPVLRQGLSRFVKGRSAWVPHFLAYALGSDDAVAFVARLVRSSGPLPTTGEYAGLDARILTRLLAVGDFAESLAYLESLGTRSLASDSRFTAMTVDKRLGPLAWTFTEQGETTARWVGNGAIEVQSSAVGVAPVAIRTLMLPPGLYKVRVPPALFSAATDMSFAWTIRCLPANDVAIFRWQVSNRAILRGQSAEMTIGTDCAAQRIALDAVAAAEQQDITATLPSLNLEPVQGPALAL